MRNIEWLDFYRENNPTFAAISMLAKAWEIDPVAFLELSLIAVLDETVKKETKSWSSIDVQRSII